MNSLKPLVVVTLFLLSVGFLSCNEAKRIKIIDKYEDGTKKIVYTYPDKDDTLKHLREYFHRNGN